MNEQIHEQLSALMDGELERDQARFLLKRIATDDSLPLRWSRYHVTRQTLRRQEVMIVSGFADSVMARIDLEAGVRTSGGHWLRWGAGSAIAASVAVAALVLTRPALDNSPAPTLVARGAPSAAAPANAPRIAAGNAPALEFQAPLLAPGRPVETAPASFGTSGFSQMTPIDPQAQLYLFHPQSTAEMSVQPGFVPYVLLANPQHADPARAASAPLAERKLR
jgi:sigma-E factor negative regulatory protein RseA